MAKNILVVDDAAFMRMMIKDILTKNGYNVAGEAENGAKALEKYNELKPDLVLISCVLQWDSRPWLSKLFRQEPRTLLLSPSSLTVFWKR
jgi:two-component system chemotaxis response regulator CheY